MESLPGGAFTALVTPMLDDGEIDLDGLAKNVDFQVSAGISGIVPVGTTGESPTLNQEEHDSVIRFAALCGRSLFVLAGCGSNSTEEAIHYMQHAERCRCNGALLVDPYYNAPSSGETALYYYQELAMRFKDMPIVPYIIPGRTGGALSEVDLAMLAWGLKNVVAVKEATGDFERMRRTRQLTPPMFKIFSGDDDRTSEMMKDHSIGACGVISVISNIAPRAVQRMCEHWIAGEAGFANTYHELLTPLFKVVTVFCDREVQVPTTEPGVFRKETVRDKYRNPLAIKTMMAGLGMPAGPCRSPLGEMTLEGVEIVRRALQDVWVKKPSILEPIGAFYEVDVAARLADDSIWRSLARG